MGLREMQILFDNSWATYYTGSKVSGRLVLNLDSPKKVREIKVKFKGSAEVKWSETESYTNAEGKSDNRIVDYVGDETYFENKYTLAGECEIPAGTHNYDFSTILPPILPSSYEGEHGHIRYTVKVTLDRPWKFDQECKAAFTVICPVDLNYSQEARMPLQAVKEKSVGMLCCNAGQLSASMTAPVSGYASGQTIPVTVDVENGTNVNMTKGTVELQKVVTYTVRSPHTSTKTETVTTAEQKISAIGAHGNNTSTHDLVIPPLPATNNVSCKIITISYQLRLKTYMDGMMYRGLEVITPVLIGTVPLVSFQPSAPPAATGPTIGWAVDNTESMYPNLPPPTYEESTFGKAGTIKDKDDNEHTMGTGGWVPRYPSFNFTPSAPTAN